MALFPLSFVKVMQATELLVSVLDLMLPTAQHLAHSGESGDCILDGKQKANPSVHSAVTWSKIVASTNLFRKSDLTNSKLTWMKVPGTWWPSLQRELASGLWKHLSIVRYALHRYTAELPRSPQRPIRTVRQTSHVWLMRSDWLSIFPCLHTLSVQKRR